MSEHDERAAGDRQPPHDLDAEKALLGACLNAPRALDEAIEAVLPEDFYRPGHAELFRTMLGMRERGREVDPITVHDQLGDRAVALGGGPYLHELLSAVGTAANVGYYAEIVAGHSVRRRLRAAGQRAIQLAHEAGADPGELVERARDTLDQVAAATRSGTDVYELDQLVDRALQRWTSPAPPCLPTGWRELDAMLGGGLRPGALTVIGARPGVGKTLMGASLASSVSMAGYGTLVVSLEMTEAELTDRIVSDLASVPLERIARVQLTAHDWDAVQAAGQRIRSWPLAVVDDPYLSLTGIRSIARDRVRTERGLGLIVVDYLQLISPADTRVPREQQISALSRGLKLLAKELRVPVVALAQLNRGSAQRQDRKPAITDLRESGAIEADADCVWLLHRDEEGEGRFDLQVQVAKNRGGRSGLVRLPWSPHFARVGGNARLEAV